MPGGDAEAVTVTPWPFAGDEVVAGVTGRLLGAPAPTQEGLQAAIDSAPIEHLRVRLCRTSHDA
jgi:hypothetical protein